jgi:hypothetical protein
MPPRSRSEPEMLRGSLPQGGRTKTLTRVSAGLLCSAPVTQRQDRVADRRRRRS